LFGPRLQGQSASATRPPALGALVVPAVPDETELEALPSVESCFSTIGAPTLLHRRSTAREFVLSTLLLSREGRSGSSRHR
jgi:hypothetical protein